MTMPRSTPGDELPPDGERTHKDAPPSAHGARADAAAAIDAQAATWLVSRQGSVNAADEAAFQRWLEHSAVHRSAYDRICEAWQALDRVPRHEIERLRGRFASTGTDAGDHFRHEAVSLARRALLPRVAMAGSAVALVGAGVIGWRHWQQSLVFAQDYETGRGQFRSVTLADGSVLQLDTGTRLEVRLFRHRREVRLLRGQAMFTVAADRQRPFDVLARAVTVTVLGTRFAVRCTETGLDGGNVRVAVEEGHVRVGAGQPEGAPRATVELFAGQTVATDANGRLLAATSMPPARVATWRAGRLNFDDTTLVSALQEFARYGAVNVAVHDPAVRAMRLTGSFEIAQVGRFVQALPRVLPVRLRQRGETVEIVRAG
ncbi:FecR family protein [Chitinasiproducens palmae]|uniref:FecR family protein n=1 Tax=Chitinasiproducens palmae TaxID=1770053 RepID=A0A1H2PJ20_9BURK|nr:FecR domain-containing protein [Chitinasiproducens palmae]SDV46198.1 FecR family protein [Chitinasiproducens palmae]